MVKKLFGAERDVIVFDQRGVGLSKPALDCPAASELDLELLDHVLNGKQLTPQEESDLMLNAMLACQKDLSGITKLSVYNSAASAADVNDLRVALGYDQVNLWGISYGTRLALTVMRDYPRGIRSVVLDSVYPPDVNVYVESPANTMRAFNVLFNGCAADKECNAAYPDLRKVFFDTAAALTKSPTEVSATNPLNGKEYRVLLDGEALVGLVMQMLYDTGSIPDLPQIIYQAKEGDYESLTAFMGAMIANETAMSPGMQYSVQCNEERSFTNEKDYDAAIAQYPELAAYYTDATKLGFAICNGWGAGKAAANAKQPVSSAIPALVMAGEYDPVTPPAWAKRAAQTLSKSYFFEYPGLGHGVSVDDACSRDMMIAFVQNPTTAPDNSCIAKMSAPSFTTPGQTEQVELEPYTNSQMGFVSVVPTDWTEIGAGTYARGQSSLDQTALIQLSSTSATSLQVAQAMVQSLGMSTLPASVGTYKGTTITWKLYGFDTTVQGQKLSIGLALADISGRAYIVMLITAPAEFEALTDSVFLPVLDAMKALK
jgi:pimeloyl-ACP methyl ester carboxylesterase